VDAELRERLRQVAEMLVKEVPRNRQQQQLFDDDDLLSDR
jgi:hypothetical protein